MKIALLGAGNVATHLSKALIKKGHPVIQVWSNTRQNAVDLALAIGADSIASVLDLSLDAELVIIAVKDDAIEEVAKQIPATSKAIVVHTSGSTAMAVLRGRTHYGVLYPLQTFSKAVDVDFDDVPLFLEASDPNTEIKLNGLASQLSARVQLADSAQRLILHVAAVFACNFTNHFYSIGEHLLKQQNLDFNLLRPLIAETAEKALKYAPSSVQTGPAVRHDVQTMNKHLEALTRHPDLQELYRSVSQNIVKNC
ncbi:Rossmann-like and DUF2520 domain-containing protein [Pelobium manganitolerans]|uniref:Rossmann-like and DUF2520 domain-containing protein n=1 Tax=Pelobium manganitolerans TaxID=1842495 RepID=UPI003FA34680